MSRHRDPRSHRRYVTTRAAWLPTAHPICCLCGKPVDTTLPGIHPDGPTVEHTLPIRRILTIATSWDEVLALTCDTSLWRLAHKVCQDRQGAHVVGQQQRSRRTPPRQPSRAW